MTSTSILDTVLNVGPSTPRRQDVLRGGFNVSMVSSPGVPRPTYPQHPAQSFIGTGAGLGAGAGATGTYGTLGGGTLGGTLGTPAASWGGAVNQSFPVHPAHAAGAARFGGTTSGLPPAYPVAASGTFNGGVTASSAPHRRHK